MGTSEEHSRLIDKYCKCTVRWPRGDGCHWCTPPCYWDAYPTEGVQLDTPQSE